MYEKTHPKKCRVQLQSFIRRTCTSRRVPCPQTQRAPGLRITQPAAYRAPRCESRDKNAALGRRLAVTHPRGQLERARGEKTPVARSCQLMSVTPPTPKMLSSCPPSFERLRDVLARIVDSVTHDGRAAQRSATKRFHGKGLLRNKALSVCATRCEHM